MLPCRCGVGVVVGVVGADSGRTKGDEFRSSEARPTKATREKGNTAERTAIMLTRVGRDAAISRLSQHSDFEQAQIAKATNSGSPGMEKSLYVLGCHRPIMANRLKRPPRTDLLALSPWNCSRDVRGGEFK